MFSYFRRLSRRSRGATGAWGVGREARETAAGPDGDWAEVIGLYWLLARLPALRGKPPACWCRHNGEARTAENACHPDVLLELLGRHNDAELRAMGEG